MDINKDSILFSLIYVSSTPGTPHVFLGIFSSEEKAWEMATDHMRAIDEMGIPVSEYNYFIEPSKIDAIYGFNESFKELVKS